MWKLTIMNPCCENVLDVFEGKSLRDLEKKYNEKYTNNFITYNKLENIKLGRCVKAHPFLILERL